jgi:LuxR family maltose regulon positive regulatory protein
LQQAETLLNDAESAIEEHTVRALRAEIAVFYAEYWYYQNEGERSLEYTRLALEYLPKTHLFARGTAVGYQGFAQQMTGRKATAIRFLHNELEKAEGRTNAYTIRLYLLLATIYLTSGEYDRLVETARQLYQHAAESKNLLMVAWSNYLMGIVCYEWDKLDKAEEYWKRAVELRYSSHVRVTHESLLGLTLVYQARGSYTEADESLEALFEFDEAIQLRGQVAEARSIRALLTLKRGDMEVALRWLRTLDDDDMGAKSLLWMVFPRLIQIRVLLAQGTDTSLRNAMLQLDEIISTAEAVHNTPHLVEALGLQALGYSALGQEDQSLEALERAVTLARPGGFVRTFIDLGPDMQGLLSRLAERGFAQEYIRRVLGAFPSAAPPQQASTLTEQRGQPEQSKLVEPLTDRELEVLMLLSERLSDKEIAQELSISALTVKTHTNNIYQKLGVNRRREAVEKALAHNILPSHENWDAYLRPH